MIVQTLTGTALAVLLMILPAGLGGQSAPTRSGYDALRAFFSEWRRFEEPPRVNGIPDYTPPTNARRLTALTKLQARLAAIDTTGWPIPQQVDYHLVRAEMNGMQYQLTVLKPFARDPAYYASIRTEESDTPSEEGPTIHGVIRLWQYGIWPRTVLDTVRPLSAEESARLTAELRTIPPLLTQARVNLAQANARDIWVGGVRAFEEQADVLATLQARAGTADTALAHAIADARSATERFAAWLRAEAPKQTGPSGIGKAQYTWYLRNVLLMPLTWDEEVTITAPRAGPRARLAAPRGDAQCRVAADARRPERRGVRGPAGARDPALPRVHA